MKEFKINTKSLIKYGIILVFSALFMLFFSLWTSPFYKNWYGCDASFFTMAGRGIVNGWVPYRDFFDLKGPCFFFIEALSQIFIKGRTGAYIMQVFSLFFTYVLMIKTCRLFISRKKTVFILGVFSFFHIATLWGGNTLEEYMLPLSLLIVYLVLRDIMSTNEELTITIKPSTALITGLCFGIILFSKITVGAPIAGIVITICIYYIQNKRFRDLIEYLLFSLLGLLIVTTIVFVYFSIYGMLSEMIYSVFIFAFKRSVDFGEKFNIRWELKVSPCYFALIFAILQLKKNPPFYWIKKLLYKFKSTDDILVSSDSENTEINALSGSDSSNSDNYDNDSSDIKNSTKNGPEVYFMLKLIVYMSLLTAICLHFGTPFIYYFTTVYPILLVTFIAMFMIYEPFTLFRNARLDIAVLLFLIPLCYYASFSADTLNTFMFGRNNTYYQNYYDKAKEMASLIPEGDRNSVYSINMDMQWFEITDILPCYSYTINLQFFVALDGRIQDRIIDKIEKDPPKWVVVGGDLASYLPTLAEHFFKDYTLIYDNEYGALYIHN